VQSNVTLGDLEPLQLKLLARETHLRHATAVSDSDINSAQLERDLHELREIDAALERMHSGTYGFCIRCGKPLDRARLELFPAARFDMCCMEDEEIDHEHRHAVPESPLIGKPHGAPPP
jgi:RNA polymerase-binding transcription factor DksA